MTYSYVTFRALAEQPKKISARTAFLANLPLPNFFARTALPGFLPEQPQNSLAVANVPVLPARTGLPWLCRQAVASQGKPWQAEAMAYLPSELSSHRTESYESL